GRPPGTSAQPGMQPTSVRLPLAYFRILEAEAARFSLRRGAFLTLILQKKVGLIPLERPKDAPVYTFTEAELTDANPCLWSLPPEMRKLPDRDCIHMGLQSNSAWITQVLNHWIGQPMGLRTKSAKG